MAEQCYFLSSQHTLSSRKGGQQIKIYRNNVETEQIERINPYQNTHQSSVVTLPRI